MVKNKEVLTKIIEWFIVLQPVIDFLTSLSVRFSDSSLTFGIVVRVLFTGLICFYLVFLYKGRMKKAMIGYLLAVIAYGIIFIGINIWTGGLWTVVENAKMFFKIFYFLFVLFFFYARYLENGHLIGDKLLVVIFAEYAVSIFVSAVTNTSFVAYEFAEGYVGWFYAANEIGAVIAILAPVALLFAFETKKLWIKIAVGFLACFAAVYIGTKVPFYAVIGAILMLIVFYVFKTVSTKKGMETLAQGVAMVVMLTLLYQINSPMKQNSAVFSGEHFESHVIEKLEPEDPDDPGTEEPSDITESKFFLVANWFLSDRLYYAENAIVAYGEADLLHKAVGLGHHFQLKDGRTLIEMDFLALVINHGIVGFLLYMLPIIYFAILCISMLFKNIKYFFKMRYELTYTYAVLIGMGCAFLAGHVLVAPAVSVYVAIMIIKLYASFKAEKFKEVTE